MSAPLGRLATLLRDRTPEQWEAIRASMHADAQVPPDTRADREVERYLRNREDAY